LGKVMKKILIVDETPLLKKIITATMIESGPWLFSCDLACSTKSAINMLRQKVYDLLLINYQTDSLDSLDILRQLRDADYQTDAVVVSGWLTPQLVECGNSLGVKRIFRLPAEFLDLTCHLKFC
jgi:DNA-binding NarL/FixJ family response regulator